VAAQTGAFKEMLFLSRSVLCSNLLAVYALNGETLVIFLGAKLDKRRVYLLVDGTTHDERSNRSKSIQDKQRKS
jgi:hypothetical protein